MYLLTDDHLEDITDTILYIVYGDDPFGFNLEDHEDDEEFQLIKEDIKDSIRNWYNEIYKDNLK